MPGFPTTHVDEKEQLLAFLAQQRSVLRLSAYGLSEEQARESPTVSPLTIGGLLKHVAKVEDHWIGIVLERPAAPDPENYDQGFVLGADESLSGVLSAYEAAAAQTEEVARTLPIDHPVPVPPGVPWFPSDIEAWTLRWVLLHLIEETARHAGHADIIRESIDGATWFPLLSAADKWDLRPWVEPWQPKVAELEPS
jgi:uncharacterized damage-inducible protein DinB